MKLERKAATATSNRRTNRLYAPAHARERPEGVVRETGDAFQAPSRDRNFHVSYWTAAKAARIILLKLFDHHLEILNRPSLGPGAA
jgi:hypothetical protein